MKKSDVVEGAILTCMWGYNCCRYSFYKVEKVSGQFCTLREISKVYVEGAPNSPCSTVVPDDTHQASNTIRRKIKVYDAGTDKEWACVSISDYKSCHGVHKDGNVYNECCD